MGWNIPPEVCARAAELDDRVFLTGIFHRRDLQDGDVEGWVRRKQEITRMLLADSPRLYPGVADLVRQLAGRVKLAVVSSSWRENIAIVLGTSGLSDAFQLILGKEDFARSKPEPEAYLKAIERLDVAPDQAVALEDSAVGLTSARIAGLRCVAVGHRRPPGDWTRGAPYLPDLTDTKLVLSRLGLRSRKK